MRRPATLLALVVAATVLAGCGAGGRPSSDPGVPVTSRPVATGSPDASATVTPTPTEKSPTPTPSATPTPTATRPPLGTVPPAWLGTRVLPRTAGGYGEIRPTPPELRNRRFTLPDTVPMLPGTGFASRILSPPPPDVLARSTWAPGCPVAKDQLAWVRLTFRGFDHQRHTGELLVNKGAARPLVRVFGDLYAADYPIEEMRITRKDEQTAPPTGDGNDTGAFNCRPVRGATTYSQHAYGLAVDVNPFQNPYTKGDLVLPELASAYLDRSRHAPGVIHPDGVVVRAFAGIGWGWGGSWHSLKDYQHFSANGR